MEIQTRLIMVEGVPFTGKSTLSEFVAQQLRLNGIEAHWVSEGMLLHRHFPHVLASFDQQQQPVSEAQLWEEWSAFVQAIMAAPTPFVVDSALSYVAIFPLLEADRPTGEILAFCNRVAELCAPLQPRVIHLTGDVDYLVRASIVGRGKGWEEQLVSQSEAAPYQQARGRTGVEGAISLEQDVQALTGRVLESGWQALTLNVTPPDRPANQRDILDFLGIAEVPFERPTLAQSVLQSYTGSYATDDPEAQLKLLSVQLEQDGLVLHGPDTRYDALIPLSETRFHLRASPLDFEFVAEEGVARRLLLFTSDGKTRVYLRV
jgi:hypothetical protein